ncbi:putative Mitochondrial import inner membrane translocase subunit Tim21 [Hypsibius exemplaris]|uniref:Mitochondrial import inner membrane translocase subunit Tim21 n=1 Tax=Hypsibius exemplaris TaxID=2072580 RepID=A0A9X6RK88_HYPEX|nr:putative Mitochondrial import inner membrane translocase subunit Tim21 [Hypsibius exemplaris]
MMICFGCTRRVLSLRFNNNRTTGWTSSFFSTATRLNSVTNEKSSVKPPSATSENSAVKPVNARNAGSSDLPSLHVAEKVKQAGKDVFWTGIVLAGVAVTGVMGYAIFHELFSSKSPSGVYADAFKMCKKDIRVKSILGEPMKAYGDLGSRGRRRHVQSAEFSDGGAHIVQLKFHLSGPHSSGAVYVEKDVSAGTYRNLIFETDDRRERFFLLAPAQPSFSSSLFS